MRERRASAAGANAADIAAPARIIKLRAERVPIAADNALQRFLRRANYEKCDKI
jgi:hypothetical protein